jgi:hypothetical protein
VRKSFTVAFLEGGDDRRGDLGPFLDGLDAQALAFTGLPQRRSDFNQIHISQHSVMG